MHYECLLGFWLKENSVVHCSMLGFRSLLALGPYSANQAW